MLKKEQKQILKTVFSSKIKNIATWGGGTALSEIYLHHRKSDDIDIILFDLPPEIELTILTNQIRKNLMAKNKKSIVKMNRFQYVFSFDREKQQKLEFVYYPFKKLEKIKTIDLVKIESLYDIAVSKTLAAYQRKEIKDTYDLFIILNKKHFTLKKLIDGVEKKFQEKIDVIALLSKLSESLSVYSDLKPYLIEEKISKKTIQDFFQNEFNKILKNQKL